MDGCLRFFNAISLLLSLAFSRPAFADRVNAEWYSPLRTLTMGNAGIALSDDPDTSMFYNPAGLARARKTNFEYFNPQLEIGSSDFGLTHSAFSVGKNFGLDSIQPSLAEHPGKVSSSGLSLYPNVQTQNFAFGVAVKADGSSYMDSNGTLHYQSQYLVVPTVGFAAALLGGRWRIGLALRGVQLAENNRSTTDFTNIGYLDSPSEGFAPSFDAGTQISLPWYGLPTIGLVARNIGNTSFKGSAFTVGSNPLGGIPVLQKSFDAGLSFQPKFNRSDTLTLSMDYRDLTNTTDTAGMRKVNLGTEFAFSHFLYLRAGFSQGYFTAGMGVEGKKGSIDLGTYAEELDDTNYHVVEDRRLALRFGSKF